jgi:hypothetical protein
VRHARLAVAVVVGLVLGTMPWWRYAAPGLSGGAHASHDPAYGGQLAMVGEHHVELVRDGRRLEVHVSDAWRRPVRPLALHAVVDGGPSLPLEWQGHRFVGAYAGRAHEIETIVTLPESGETLRVAFHVGDPPEGRRPVP